MVILDESDENNKLQTIGVQNNQVEPILLTYQLFRQKIMRTIIVIVNGISLPYNVIDYAIAEAKKSSFQIHAIFLKGTREPSKGYLYPSDLRTVETGVSDEESVLEDQKIIEENMHLVRELIENEKIPFTATLKTNASGSEVVALTANADLVVVDENFDEVSLLNDNKISLKDLKRKISGRVYVVPSSK
jgi:hypothetical protein